MPKKPWKNTVFLKGFGSPSNGFFDATPFIAAASIQFPDLRDLSILTFTILEGKFDSSIDDFFLQVEKNYLLRKNRQNTNRFSPRGL